MAGKHKQSPLLSIGTIPDMTDHDYDCAWESSDDIDCALGESADTAAGDTIECGNAVTGSSTPAADSASAEDAVPGGSGELCEAGLSGAESHETPAQCNLDCAWEPDLPSGDVHSTSASEWEIVSKMSTQEE